MAKAVARKPTAAAVRPANGQGAVVVPDELAAELAADTGKGFEEANRESFAVPFLRVLQDLSPQVKTKMAGYIEDAKPGMIFNTVSHALYDKVTVIPCHFSQSYIEWTPRDKGGGLVAVHPPGTPLVAQAVRDGGKFVLPNGNDLMDTRSHFILVVEKDGSSDGALLAMSSTGLKVSRRWMSQMRSAVIEVAGKIITPPMFAWSYVLGAEEESNDQGQWYNWTILDRQRVTNANLYRAAKLFGATMKSGTVKVNYEEELRGGGGQRSSGASGSAEEIPNDIDA
jgi:hypothetical protein